MDDRYQDYFSFVFRRVGEWPGLFPAYGEPEEPGIFAAATAVHDAVQSASEEFAARYPEVQIRSDAQLFLWLNAWHLVVRPAMEVRAYPLEELLSAVEDDLNTVLEAAVATSPTRELSGHRLLSALADAWGDLRLTQASIWED